MRSILIMKHAILFLILLFVCKVLFAPEHRSALIEYGKKIDPYKRVIEAISWVESRRNDNSINWTEFAYGRYQIRQIRLTDYFQRTGIRYTLTDMLDSAKAGNVIRYYASSFGPYNTEGFILDWNCGSREYLRKVKKQLLTNK